MNCLRSNKPAPDGDCWCGTCSATRAVAAQLTTRDLGRTGWNMDLNAGQRKIEGLEADLVIARAEANGYAQQAGALRRERDEARNDGGRLRTELVQIQLQLDGVKALNECYHASRSFWPLSLRDAISRGDLEAVKAEAARAEKVVEGWLNDSHALGELRAARDTLADDLATLRVDLDLHKAALADAQRVRDECAAEAVTLRKRYDEAMGYLSSFCNGGRPLEGALRFIGDEELPEPRAAEVFAGIEQRARAKALGEAETRRVEARQEWVEAIHATVGRRPEAGSTARKAIEFACGEARAATLEEAASSLVPKPDATLAGKVLVAFCQGKIRSLIAPPASVEAPDAIVDFLTHVLETRYSSPVLGVTQEQFLACVEKLRAVAQAPDAKATCATCGGRQTVRTHPSGMAEHCPDCGGTGARR